MRYISLIVGCFATFKSGPLSIGGFLSLSDVACAINIGLFFAYILALSAQQSRVLLLNVNPIALAPFVLIIFVAMAHAVVAEFAGADFSTAITMTLIFLSAYAFIQNNYFLSSEKDRKVSLLYFFIGVVSGLTLPYLANKVGVVPDSSVYFYPGGRYKGFMLHQNQVGILSTFCVAFFSLTKMKLFRKFVALAACFVPLLLCTSKFNLAFSMAIMLSWGIYLIPSIPTFPIISRFVNLVLIAILFLLCYVYMMDIIDGGVYVLSIVNPDGAERLAEFAASPEDSEATLSRLLLWDQAWKVGSENLPFGIGPAEAPRHLMMLSHAHNAVLNFYLIYGIFGVAYVASVAALTVMVIWMARTEPSSFAASVATFAAFIASNISDSFSNSTALPLLTALALAYSSLSLRKFERRRRRRHNQGSWSSRLKTGQDHVAGSMLN